MYNFLCLIVIILLIYALFTKRIDICWSGKIETFWCGDIDTFFFEGISTFWAQKLRQEKLTKLTNIFELCKVFMYNFL